MNINYLNECELMINDKLLWTLSRYSNKAMMILKSLQTTIFESNLAVQNSRYLIVALGSFNADRKTGIDMMKVNLR